MTQIEYLIALLSILVGLALADMVRSLRALIRSDQRVRWHWLPLTWAAVVFLMIVQVWWSSFGILQLEVFAQALPFFGYLMGFLALYLAASFALPDSDMDTVVPEGVVSSATSGAWKTSEFGGEVLDLERFYFSTSHRRRFFGTLVAFIVLAMMTTFAVRVIWEGDPVTSTGVLHPLATNMVFGLILAGLIATEMRWVHAGAAILSLAGVMLLTALQGPLP